MWKTSYVMSSFTSEHSCVGLGTYAPKVGLNGVFDVAHRLDKALKNRLNASGDFKVEIGNRDMIGKTADELVARWDEEHPDDPVE